MRTYRPTYKRDGEIHGYKNFYIEMRDHNGIVRRFPAYVDRRQSQALGKKIELLVNYHRNREPLSKELSEWLNVIPSALRNRFAKIGLLDSKRVSAAKPLSEHLNDFYNSLLAKGTSDKQAGQVKSRAERIIDGCGFAYWTDISASRVQSHLAELKDDGLSVQTRNFYLQAIRQFARWMVQDGRAIQSPVDYLKAQKLTKADKVHNRRALTVDEARKLIEAARSGADYQSVSGYERSLVYTLAIETGLRANELRSLTVSCFDFSGCTVSLDGVFTKNGKSCTLPLKPETAAELKRFCTGKLPNAKAFTVPAKTYLMIKSDLEAAGIAYRDDSGRYADFHSLRHTTGTLLAAAGIYPKVVQDIMRHSDIGLTMNIYTHSATGQQAQAIQSLPDLSSPKRISESA